MSMMRPATTHIFYAFSLSLFCSRARDNCTSLLEQLLGEVINCDRILRFHLPIEQEYERLENHDPSFPTSSRRVGHLWFIIRHREDFVPYLVAHNARLWLWLYSAQCAQQFIKINVCSQNCSKLLHFVYCPLQRDERTENKLFIERNQIAMGYIFSRLNNLCAKWQCTRATIDGTISGRRWN